MTALFDVNTPTAQATSSCGEILTRLLALYDVDTVFGIPGTHTLQLMQSMQSSGLRFVQPRHEQGAGFMADGYARISGRPGVCLLISGPGLLNAATAIAQAYSDSVPMLVVSSALETSDLSTPRGHIHELRSQQGTMATLTAFSATAYRAEQLDELVARAWAVFEGGRPRPAHIQIPLDVATTEAPWNASRRQMSRHGAADNWAFERAVSVINSARLPLIIAGGGTVDCTSALAALAERIAAPVVTTIAAKGVLPDDHPLVVGSPLTEAAGRAVLAEADLVIAVGTELAASDSWIDRLALPSLVRIDVDALQAAANYAAEVTLVGDAGATMAALESSVAAAGPTLRRNAERLVAEFRARYLVTPGSLQARHVAVLQAIRLGLGRDGFLAADMTQPAYTANVHFPCYAPRRYFYPTGLSTLGFALPVAIGARLAAPEVPAAVLIGDGGFMFTATELATAVELGIGLPVVIWNNHGLAQIRMHMADRGIPAVGVNSLNPDFMALARAFGCHALRPVSLDELAKTITAAQHESVPTIIEVRDEDKWTA